MLNYFKALLIVILLYVFILPRDVSAQVPLPPVLEQPLNNSVGVSLTPNLQWIFLLPAGDLLAYRVQISTEGDFTPILFDDATVQQNHFNVPANLLQNTTQYYWRVSAIIRIGNVTMSTSYSTPFSFTTIGLTGVSQISSVVPGEYKLYNNYPNPFNPATTIKFDIKSASAAEIAIFNSAGAEVSKETFGMLSAGTYQYKWEASNMPSGVYYYRLSSGEFAQTKKMVLIK